jgi:pSer/pThr/pTyr-binding forkhead associated (FHA) protein
VASLRLRIGGQSLTLADGKMDIGRIADCWLVLADDQVSRYHSRLHVAGEVVQIEDLGSRNGTFINGRRIKELCQLADGDEIKIGRETISVCGANRSERVTARPTARTMIPTPVGPIGSHALMSGLIEKSLGLGRIKEAERYAVAMTNQLMRTDVEVDHPTVQSCIRLLISIAEKTASGLWLDRVFRLYAVHGWIMSGDVLEMVRAALDRIPRVPGTGLSEYEDALRALRGEGVEVSRDLLVSVAELSDTFGSQCG